MTPPTAVVDFTTIEPGDLIDVGVGRLSGGVPAVGDVILCDDGEGQQASAILVAVKGDRLHGESGVPPTPSCQLCPRWRQPRDTTGPEPAGIGALMKQGRAPGDAGPQVTECVIAVAGMLVLILLALNRHLP